MTPEEQKKIFGRNLSHYVYQSGKQQAEIAKDIGEKPTTFNMWCNGKAMPSVGKIQKLADYFKVGKSDLTDDKNLLKGIDEYTSVSAKIGLQDERFQRIVIEYYNMPADKKDLFCDFFENFLFAKKN